MITPEERLGQLVREAFSVESGEFRPCAWFEERLDCIRVLVRDCSILESRVNDRLTVLEDNYYQEGGRGRRFVGFTFKGARYFCKQQGWSLTVPIKMTDFVDAILKSFPELVVEWFVDQVARPLLEEEHIEQIEVSEGFSQESEPAFA
jgi:hypothetical protein